MKTYRLSNMLSALLLCCVSLSLMGHNTTDSIDHRLKIDSLVVSSNGDSTFYFKRSFYDFGETYKAPENQFSGDMQSSQSGIASIASIENMELDRSGYVGQIPYTHNVTPTGGKSYAVPVMTALSSGIVPELSITYNSQSGNGVAGMGWSLSGLSSISVTNKNLYYAGTVSSPQPGAQDMAFTLDGVRLVPNVKIAEYPLETVQGQILVKPVYSTSSSPNVTCFEVLYPNGTKAKYGFSNGTTYIYPVVSIEDMKGYRIDFEYTRNGKDSYYYVSKIKYGSKSSSSHYSKIEFQYVDRFDIPSTYILGNHSAKRSMSFARIQ